MDQHLNTTGGLNRTAQLLGTREGWGSAERLEWECGITAGRLPVNSPCHSQVHSGRWQMLHFLHVRGEYQVTYYNTPEVKPVYLWTKVVDQPQISCLLEQQLLCCAEISVSSYDLSCETCIWCPTNNIYLDLWLTMGHAGAKVRGQQCTQALNTGRIYRCWWKCCWSTSLGIYNKDG